MRDFGIRISDVGFAILGVFLFFNGNSFGQAQAGNEKFQAKQYAEAVTAYEGVPQAERNAGLLNRLGLSYHMLNRLKEAENAYRQAIKVDPRFHDPNNNLGVLFIAQLKFGNAEGQIRRALQINPESSIARLNLRVARYARENSRSARTR